MKPSNEPKALHPARRRVMILAGVTQGLSQGLRNGLGKAQAIMATTQRATKAPGHTKMEMKAATDSYTHSITTGIGLYTGAGVIALAAFIVLTAGIVVALNLLLGAPAGYFLTVLLYLILAGVLGFVGKTRSAAHKKDAQAHIQHIREEYQHVKRPITRAFGSNGK